MTLKCQSSIGLRHTYAIVNHLNTGTSSVSYQDTDTTSTSIGWMYPIHSGKITLATYGGSVASADMATVTESYFFPAAWSSAKFRSILPSSYFNIDLNQVVTRGGEGF